MNHRHSSFVKDSWNTNTFISTIKKYNFTITVCCRQISSSVSVGTVLVLAGLGCISVQMKSTRRLIVSSRPVCWVSSALWRLSCLCLLFPVRAETHQAECPGFSALVSYTLHSYSSSRSDTPWSLGTADWQEEKVRMKVQSKVVFSPIVREIKRSYCLLGSDRLASM